MKKRENAASPDRRTQPRYKFAAAIQIVEDRSGAQVEGRVGDISETGCYVDTNSPLPLGTAAKICITSGNLSFAAEARVVYSSAKGMGLQFIAAEPEQLRTLATWLASSAEAKWLLINRRRSQRITLRVPVRVSGKNALGLPFEEETQTMTINADGALILLSASVNKGQRLALLSITTQAAAECIVAYIGTRHGDRLETGLGFILSNPRFWHVAFPPDDWNTGREDAKARPES